MPDLPGCASVGCTLGEVKAEIREAIEFHLERMREDGSPIPRPTNSLEYVEVARCGGGQLFIDEFQNFPSLALA